ncbi:hypothetical protein CRE_24943 [Caenorhabditis remanei]|uniref:Homeobox domain-containing protein n=1 Tax=Caenorhabditis remanei TaxID=31234 RepID=E3MHW9_CAERE|nr:hypothetical protein CRE_24943 [Caenorhabditis remanei]
MVEYYYDPFSNIPNTEYPDQLNSSNETGILELSGMQSTVTSSYSPYGNSCHQNVPCQQTYSNSSYGYPQHINSHQNYQHPNYFPDLQPLALHYQPYQPQFKASRLFTTEQIFAMEQKFKEDCFISPEEGIALADMIGLSKRQVMSWFERRRAKQRNIDSQKENGDCNPEQLDPTIGSSENFGSSYNSQHTMTQFLGSRFSYPDYQPPHYQPYQPPLPVFKSRTMFSKDQLIILEGAFKKNEKITHEKMQILMKKTDLSNAQIRTWFNNRRQRKKQENERNMKIQSLKEGSTVLPSGTNSISNRSSYGNLSHQNYSKSFHLSDSQNSYPDYQPPSHYGNFHMKEAIVKIIKIHQSAFNYNLDAQLFNRKMTPMEFANSLFDGKIEDNVFEEYGNLKLVDGLKQGRELFELLNKIKNPKTTDEMRNDVFKGMDVLSGWRHTFDSFDPMNTLDGFFEKKANMGKLETQEIRHLESNLANRIRVFQQLVDSYKQSHEESLIIGIVRQAGAVKSSFSEFEAYFQNIGYLNNDYRIVSNLIEIRPSFTKEKEEIMNRLKREFPAIESDIDTLLNVNNSQAIKEVIAIVNKLDNTLSLLNSFRISKDKRKKYQGVSKPLFQRISSLSSFMNHIQYQAPRLSATWKPLEETLRLLKDDNYYYYRNGFQTEKDCIMGYNISSDLTTSDPELIAFEEYLNNYSSAEVEFHAAWRDLSQNTKTENLVGYDTSGAPFDYLKSRVVEFIEYNFPTEALENILEMLGNKNIPGKEDISVFEETSLKAVRWLETIQKANSKELTEKLTKNIPEMKAYFECGGPGNYYTMENVRTISNISRHASSVNPNSLLFGAVEWMGWLKEAHEMIEGIKNWKSEDDPTIGAFPLAVSDLDVISDGLTAIKLAVKIQDFWTGGWEGRDDDDFEAVKDNWYPLSKAISNLVEDLDRVDINNVTENAESHLSDSVLSSIDMVRKFVRDEYDGNQWKDIQNFLDDLQSFPGFANKVNRMNEEIRKYKEWETTRHPEEKEVKKPFVDCSQVDLQCFMKFKTDNFQSNLGECGVPLNLPAAPDVPVEKFEL